MKDFVKVSFTKVFIFGNLRGLTYRETLVVHKDKVAEYENLCKNKTVVKPAGGSSRYYIQDFKIL